MASFCYHFLLVLVGGIPHKPWTDDVQIPNKIFGKQNFLMLGHCVLTTCILLQTPVNIPSVITSVKFEILYVCIIFFQTNNVCSMYRWGEGWGWARSISLDLRVFLSQSLILMLCLKADNKHSACKLTLIGNSTSIIFKFSLFGISESI